MPRVVNIKLYCRILYCTILYCFCNLRDAFSSVIKTSHLFSSHFLFFSFLFFSLLFYALSLFGPSFIIHLAVCVRGRDEISHIISITCSKERQVVYYAFLSSFILLFFLRYLLCLQYTIRLI